MVLECFGWITIVMVFKCIQSVYWQFSWFLSAAKGRLSSEESFKFDAGLEEAFLWCLLPGAGWGTCCEGVAMCLWGRFLCCLAAVGSRGTFWSWHADSLGSAVSSIFKVELDGVSSSTGVLLKEWLEIVSGAQQGMCAAWGDLLLGMDGGWFWLALFCCQR